MLNVIVAISNLAFYGFGAADSSHEACRALCYVCMRI